MSEVAPHLLQTDISEDRRPGKLHKQMEVENDDSDEVSIAEVGSFTPITTGAQAPNMQSASGCTLIESPQRESMTVTGGKNRKIHSRKGVVSTANRSIPGSPNTRNKTLIRGQALEEGTSPPPELMIGQNPHRDMPNGHLLTCGLAADAADKIGTLKGETDGAKEYLLASHKISSDSGHGTMDDASDTSVLSRDSSLENAATSDLYKDSSGVNIPKFMRETLFKSTKDKKTILALEEQLLSFVNNGVKVCKMAEMTSYERMIVHRLAAFLGVEHNVDSTGKCIILSRTEITRSIRLSDIFLCEDSRETKKKILLKKQPASFDEKHGRGSNKLQFGSHRAKSLEERQQNYNEARERIFKDDENHCEEEGESKNFLTVNFVPHLIQQMSHDHARSNGQEPAKWVSADSNSNATESNKEPPVTVCNPTTSITSYNPTPSHSSHSQVNTPVSSSGDLYQVTNSTPDVCSSIITQLPATHGHSNGLLYHLDTTCPPPLMVQPQILPPSGPVVYQNDSVSDMTARLAAASVGSADNQGAETLAMGPPAFVLHPQSVYPPTYSSQIPQGQYIVAPSPHGIQQPVKYVAIPYTPSHGQQFFHQTTVDRQGQTTVPMPTIAVPTVQGAGNFHVISSPCQPAVAVANPSHGMDMNSVMYHYRTVPESVVVNGGSGSGLNPSTAPPAAHLVLAYAQPHSQHPTLFSHVAQFVPSGNTPSGTTYYAIPVTNQTPPQSITQSAPSSHHDTQHLQQTILYTSNVGNPLTYQNPTSTSSLKTVQSSFFQTQPPQHQSQPIMVSPSNSHHPSHLTMNYNHTNKAGPQTHGPQFVALHTSPYQIRPVGPALIHLAGGSLVQTPQLGPGLQLQPYQFVQPSGSDVQLMNPNSIRPGLSPLHITTNPPQQIQQNFTSISRYSQPQKEFKKLPLSVDDGHSSQGTGVMQQPAHINIMSPLSVSGSTPQAYAHIPSYSSNRK